MNDPYANSEPHKPLLQRIWVPMLFAGLAIVPILYYGFNSEMAKWTAARAQLMYDAGDEEQGVAMMRKAISLSPNDQNLKLNLAEQLMPIGQAEEALEIINGVADVSTNPRPALYAKSTCLLYLERPVDALAAIKEIPEFAVPGAINDANLLNAIAYYRALAGKELGKANKNIEKAVRTHVNEAWWLDKLPMILSDQTLVATAIVANRIGRSDLVINLLNERIERLDGIHRSFQQDVSEQIYQEMQRGWPFSESYERSLHEKQMVLHSQKQFLAVLLTVRALIHQRSGNIEDCDRDRLAAAEWDHDPEQLLRYFPDDWDLMGLMNTGAQYLDTRAMVTWARKRDFKEAMADLDVAILALEVLGLTHETTLQNTLRDERGRVFARQNLNRVEAAVRRHRADIFTKKGLSQQAENDLKRIQELGFDRDEVLF